jgi:hypothetical protein
MGVSLEVASLQTAPSLLEANTKRQLRHTRDHLDKSILIPPEFA